MPRGPFQGTFQPNLRPTVVTAPDAIVMVNGETDVIGCPSCRRRFNWNKYITSVQVDLSIDSVPGSATISLSIPRHSIDDFYFEGNPVITPMMEVEIYAKGYYLVEGIPQYYPIFWGLITEVNDSYSGGEHSISLHCADILKWWELCKMNVNPAFTGPKGQMGMNIFGNVYFGKNPYDVIWSLAQASFGDVVIGTGSLVSAVRENGGQRPVFDAALSDMMLYWEQRFSRIRSNLMLYGVNGVAIRGDSLYETYRAKGGTIGQPFASRAVGAADGGPGGSQMFFDPTDPSVVAFRTQFNQAGQINFWQSEYQTKLELANAAKESIGFEFYMDVTGDIVFKPPFYNLDILSNKPVSWIQDIDVIDWDFSESEAEVVTQLTLQGSYGGSVDYGLPEECTPFTSVTDYHLLRKYGWRSHQYNSEFMGDPNLMFLHGLDVLDRINSKRHRATINIPCRPELRLGFPIYVAPKDQIWYISGISHNIAFGGRAQTTLTLTAKRQKFIAPRGIGQITLTGYKGTSLDKPPTPPKDAGKDAKKPTQKQAPSPSPALPFPYSSKQLSQGGSFLLKIGDAAQLPPVVSHAQEVQKNNPYEPLILRHPKTGRIVGCPNVVMAYTRPFVVPTSVSGAAAGQRSLEQAKKLLPKDEDLQSTFESVGQAISAYQQATPEERVQMKHLSNRYQYGMNSAGVYIYANETKGFANKPVIGEVLMCPSANVKTDPETIDSVDAAGKPVKVKPFPGSTSMIRPVSDERGFEVIGHYRYGRGLVLRDGRLVYQQGKTNAKASVDLQVALAGDLFATLQAQSSGLTALVSAYQNPVTALAELQPEDLQTAGFLNPNTKAPEFLPSESPTASADARGLDGTNFVDSAPIGSVEQQGLTSSVEASQLSRALTLAEMAVVDQYGSEKDKEDTCMCLLGRSDLAFINVGYQVKVLKDTVPDTGSLFNSNTFGSFTSTTGTGGAIPTTPVDTTNQIVPSPDQVIHKVEEFLWGLYSVLDDPHQAFESSIRGDSFAVSDPQTFDNMINGQPGDYPTSSLTPPFSSPNRAALGDPIAIAQQAETAKDNLKKTWTEFGDKLKHNVEKTKLHSEIAADNAKIARLTKQLESLKKSRDSHTVFVGTPPLDEQIAALEQQIADTRKEVADKQLELATLGA